MEQHSSSREKKLKTGLLVILSVLVAILVFLLAWAARDYRRAQALEKAETARSALSNERLNGPLSKAEVGDIAGWMTFDYVNYLFALPPQYLKTAVPVNDSKYPGLSLNSFARHSNQNRAAVLQAVQAAVTAHLQ